MPTPTSPNSWQLEKHDARLQLDPLRARVDLSQPADGLVEIYVARTTFPEAHLLGVAMPSFTPGDGEALIEHRARGADLVAAYRESASWPVQTDALWRAVAPTGSDGFLAAIELCLSVRTELLDSQPGLTVQTALPSAEVLRLVDGAPARFMPCNAAPDSSRRLEPDGGPGCLLFRPAGSDLSYAEMVHPADFRASELSFGSDPPAAVHVRHRLFSEPLEKGVILRARVRGVFLPRNDDTRTAAECYAAFAVAEPPLGV